MSRLALLFVSDPIDSQNNSKEKLSHPVLVSPFSVLKVLTRVKAPQSMWAPLPLHIASNRLILLRSEM